jgi:ATP-dependent Zn protease
MRRQALQGQSSLVPLALPGRHEPTYYGPWGSLTPTGDMILENEAWREHLFRQRAPESLSPYPGWMQKLGRTMNQGAFPGMFGGGMGGLALNQLLVTMDGIDNPPFMRRFLTNRLNSLLDAVYIVPRRIGKVSLRLPPPRPLGAQIYFIGATNVPMEVLDPALTRPGRMGRHVWFRTPTKEDRKDIFDLYLDRVAHDPELDTDSRRDEIARITNGYSPAMIEQICSMALTNAHHEGEGAFRWEHLFEAMTTVESGTAIGVRYSDQQARATAIHEAGHATAAHAYRPELESARLSIRYRGRALGHHTARAREETLGAAWADEEYGDLIWGLGAMAAEHVFYGQNSNGVFGDLGTVTAQAASMVGSTGMGPQWIALPADAPFDDETEAETRQRIAKRFERIGLQLMNRTRGSADFHADPIASVLNDPFKRELAAQVVGQAFVTVWNFILLNKEAVERIAEEVLEEKEIYGDHLLRLLDGAKLQKPELDWLKEETWPRI